MRDDFEDGNGGGNDEDFDAQIAALTKKKQEREKEKSDERRARYAETGDDGFAETKPKEQGKFDGEVKDGWRWDRSANDWIEHRGVDLTEKKDRLPLHLEHVGDGSPQKPHNIQQVQRW